MIRPSPMNGGRYALYSAAKGFSQLPLSSYGEGQLGNEWPTDDLPFLDGIIPSEELLSVHNAEFKEL